MHRSYRLAIVVVMLAVSAGLAGDAGQYQFLAGSTQDPRFPTPEKVLGYPLGAYHTDYARLERWLAVLKTSDRVKVLQYGETVQRRPQYLVIVSAAANIARLEEIRAGIQKLADPRTVTDAQAEQLIKTLPAVAWLNHGTDGNESAAFESAIQSSYQLAAGTDEATRQILERLVTVIVPSHSADSHERYVAWFNGVQVTAAGTADRAAAEHHAPWGVSTNNTHYMVDANRDGFFATQQETRNLVKAVGEWNPVVFVDHHGQTKNMFFPPNCEPVNANVTARQREWLDRYGKVIADSFDRRGWSYFRGRRFDLLYPGFFDSWPTLNGAVGMTFETDAGGSKGIAWEREDGTVLTLRDATAHHHTGAMSVLKLTAERKEDALRDFYQYKKTAIEEGQREPLKQVILLPGKDPARAALLVDTLRLQRIEVHQAARPLKLAKAYGYFDSRAGARDVPAGAYVIPMAQPQKRLAKAILEPEPALPEEFVKEEERKKQRAEMLGERPRDGFYDMTAWALPVLYGVDALLAEDAFVGPALQAAAEAPRGPNGGANGVNGTQASRPEVGRGSWGYAVSSDSIDSMRLVAGLLEEKINLAAATEPFRAAGRDFPRGSVVVRVERNPANLHERVAALAAETGVPVQPLDSGGVERGADFGEDSIMEVPVPRLAVVTDEPVDDRAYGATWFTLEKRLGLPFTAIKIEQLVSSPLSRYNVIVFPHGAPEAYRDALGERGIARLKRWTEDGGTLILIKGAAVMAGLKGVEWSGATLKKRQLPVRLFFDGSAEPAPAAAPQGQKPAIEKPAEKPPEPEKPATREADLPRTPGAILRVKVDPEHFLGMGYDGEVAAVITSNYAFTLSKTAKTVAAYPGEDSLRLAGFMWPETRKEMARTPYLWLEPSGRGQVILFADDPNFRATQLSTLRLFYNAVVLAPSLVAYR